MVRIVGHRGAAGLAPENTISSFKTALELGVDTVECDVRESADGHLVVIHDETVDRTTDGTGLVSEHTLSELKGLCAEGEHIPTLGEVLDILDDSGVEARIELKERGIGSEVVKGVRERDMVNMSVIISFFPEAIAEVRDTDIRTGFLSFDVEEETFHTAVDLGCEFIGVNHEWVDDEYVEEAQKHGLKPGIWTVNTTDEIRRALDLGPYSITTDRPNTALRIRDGRT